MAQDAFLQVALDGAGKRVDMDQVSTAANATVYRQRAVLVGETGDVLQQLLDVNLHQLACLRAILAIKRTDHVGAPGEDDFLRDLSIP